MAKTVTIRIGDDVYKDFIRHAGEEKRSLGKFIENAVIQHTKQSAFADDAEMDILSQDKGLARRIKQGISDAKKGRGRFVS